MQLWAILPKDCDLKKENIVLLKKVYFIKEQKIYKKKKYTW
jgi:hypothetical protein